MKLQALREEVVVLHQEDAIGEDSRFRRLPLSGASLLMAEGFGAEGNACSAEMPYGFFRPETGARGCLNGLLKNGGTHHQVMTLGLRAERWRLFAELLDVEFVRV